MSIVLLLAAICLVTWVFRRFLTACREDAEGMAFFERLKDEGGRMKRPVREIERVGLTPISLEEYWRDEQARVKDMQPGEWLRSLPGVQVQEGKEERRRLQFDVSTKQNRRGTLV